MRSTQSIWNRHRSGEWYACCIVKLSGRPLVRTNASSRSSSRWATSSSGVW